MDLNKVLAELRKERSLLDEAIAHLERLHTEPPSVAGRRPNRSYPEERRQERGRTADTAYE